MKTKSILLMSAFFQIIAIAAMGQCKWHTKLTDGFEYTTACPYVIPNTVYTSIPQTYSVHSGTRALYLNMGDSGAVTPPNVFAGDTIFKREIGVCKNISSRMSCYLTTTFSGMQSNMRMLVMDANNNVIANTQSVLASFSPAWTYYQSPVFTSSTSTIYFVMITNVGGGNGNDLSMDDFLMEDCWTLNLGNDTTLCNNQSITLNAGNNYASYLWSNGSTTQTVVATHTGSTAIALFFNVQVTDSNGCAFSDTMKVIFLPCSGVNELNSGESLVLVYPNPTVDEVTIEWNNESFIKHSYFSLNDVTGRQVKKTRIQEAKQKIGLDGIKSGVYFYQITTDEKIISKGKLQLE